MEENVQSIEMIFKERIEENKELFSEKELNNIAQNMDIIKKVYLLAMINARMIYGKN